MRTRRIRKRSVKPTSSRHQKTSDTLNNGKRRSCSHGSRSSIYIYTIIIGHYRGRNNVDGTFSDMERCFAFVSPRQLCNAFEVTPIISDVNAHGTNGSGTIDTAVIRNGCAVIDFRRRRRNNGVAPSSGWRNARPK